MIPAAPKTDLRPYVVSAILLFGTLLLFSRTLGNGFIDLDDPDYVTQNAHVLKGITVDGMRWAFTSGDSANWHPLTWLSLMLDADIYGNVPRGFHFTNNLLHALSAVLAFLALRRMTGALWTSALCAACFAWHPLRVESVAWVAERKDVLSGLFFWGTLWAYTGYARASSTIGRQPRVILYGLALLLFVCGLMSKPMLVTVPCLLLLLDWWPLQRLNPIMFRRLLFEKIPFFVLSIASCVVTFLVQKNWGAVVVSQSFGQRLVNAAVSAFRYMGNFVWPHDLAVVYPLPDHWPFITVAGALATLLICTALAIWQRKQRPWLLIGWLWFLGMLVPVIGLVQVGLQARADRYTYLPVIGLQLALFWTLREIKWKPAWKITGVTIILLVLAAQTWKQTGFWTTPQRLYEHALAVVPDNYPAECYLGTTLLNSGDFTGAEWHFRRAIQLKSDFNDARFKLGATLAQAGDTAGALTAYHDLLKINPRYVLAEYNIGAVLLNQGQPQNAQTYFQATLKSKPAYTPALVAMGTAEAKQHHPDAAIECFKKALALKPDNAVAHYNFANALTDLHRDQEAMLEYQKALQLDPGFVAAYDNYGDALEAAGHPMEARTQYRQAMMLDAKDSAACFGLAETFEDTQEIPRATACYERAVTLNPANAGAQYNLGTIYLNTDRASDALPHFESAMRAAPDNESAFLGAGLALEKLERLDEAIADYRRALAIAPDNAQAHCCLGIALRRAGRFSEAIMEDETALRLNPRLPGLPEQLDLAQHQLAALNQH